MKMSMSVSLPIRSGFLCFVIINIVFSTTMKAYGLKCYADIEGKQITTCEETEGFRTCFTKFNDKGQVIGRGCSTRDKVFYKECQTHSYGDSVEKMCFCSFFLCNGSGSKPPLTPSTWLIALAASLLIWRYLESNSQWQLKEPHNEEPICDSSDSSTKEEVQKPDVFKSPLETKIADKSVIKSMLQLVIDTRLFKEGVGWCIRHCATPAKWVIVE